MNNFQGQVPPELPVADGISESVRVASRQQGASRAERVSRWLGRIIKVAIFGLIALAPIFYLTVTSDVLFAKVLLVELVSVIVGALWLASILVAKRIRYARTVLNFGLLLLAVAIILATLVSPTPWASFWGADPTGEKAAPFLAFLVLAFVTAAVFNRKDILRATVCFLAAFLLLGAFALLSIIVSAAGSSLPAWLNVNPIGTLNALSYVIAIGFLVSVGLITSRVTNGKQRLLPRWLGILAMVTGGLLFVVLVFTGFRMLWLAVGVALMAMLAFHFSKFRQPAAGERTPSGMNTVSLGMVLTALGLSVFFAVKPVPFSSRIFQPPVEISPSLQATLAIGRRTITERPVLGMGPANFRIAYNRFRDPALNNTIFWTARFNHGFSMMSTILTTLGLAGVLVFLAFVGLAAMVIIRAFLREEQPNPWLWSFGPAALFVMLMWFLYTGNFTASLLLFLLLGMIVAALKESPRAAAPQSAPARPLSAEGSGSVAMRQWRRMVSSWSWRVRPQDIALDTPALNFAVALAAVFAAVFALIALYGFGTQFLAEIYFNRAARVFNQYGNTDSAKKFLDRAIALNPTEDAYHLGQAQVEFVLVQQLIARVAANPNQNVAEEFRSELNRGVTAAQRSTELAPRDPRNWFSLGQLYEAVIAFIPGADTAAILAYQRASEADPANPVYAFARGRVHLTWFDLLSLQINQTSSGERRSGLEVRRGEEVKLARQALEDAIGLKGDYAQAHFLLAQIALRENNLSEAIQKTEDTARLAPGDVGVRFQLAFLYYRAGDFDRAKREFEQTLLLNENYSNARYFLGLIWDRKGDYDAALSQFQKIAALNPDNEEVKRIIANLEAGRPALTGIVPPAQAPEARKEAPVEERGETSPKPLRRK